MRMLMLPHFIGRVAVPFLLYYTNVSFHHSLPPAHFLGEFFSDPAVVVAVGVITSAFCANSIFLVQIWFDAKQENDVVW